MKKIILASILAFAAVGYLFAESTNVSPPPSSFGQIVRTLPYGWNVYTSSIPTSVSTISLNAGYFGGYQVLNPGAANEYCQFFDTSPASVINLGTTPPNWVLGFATTSVSVQEFGQGVTVNYSLFFACTTTPRGNTAPGTPLQVNFLYR